MKRPDTTSSLYKAIISFEINYILYDDSTIWYNKYNISILSTPQLYTVCVWKTILHIIQYLLLHTLKNTLGLMGKLSYFQELRVWVWQMRIFWEQVIPLYRALWLAAITPWWHLLGKQSTFTVVSTIWGTDRFANCQYLIADNRGTGSLCLCWNLPANCQNTSIKS